MKRYNFLLVAFMLTMPIMAVNRPNNVIVIIGDGMGLNHICTLNSPNNFERAQAIGLSKTYSANSPVTDSAAGGTAIACGVKTNNGMLGVSQDSIPVKSILTILKENDLSTGIVVSCRINHATPAAFYAHQPNRGMDSAIVSDLYKSNIDVIVGGGAKFVSTDSLKNLGYEVCNNLDDLKSVKKVGKIACLLAKEDMPVAEQRKDTIPQAVQQALRLLSQNKKGFFLMIEASQIDWASHGNNAKYLKTEIQDINAVLGACMDFADVNPGTLIIVTADHETGGVSLLENEKEYKFSTGKHTGVMVPIYSYGTGAENFSKIQENTGFKNKILDLMHISK